MKRPFLVPLLAAAALSGAGLGIVPGEAHASPTGQGMSLGPPRVPAPLTPACDHRGLDHIDKHGGKAEDDRFHLSHHQRVTCDGQDKDNDQPGDLEPFERHEGDLRHDEPHDEHKDRDNDKGFDIPRNDTPGYGCHWTRCG